MTPANFPSTWKMLPPEASVYLAGPMRGLPRYGFDAFARAAEYIRYFRPDIKIYSPADHDLAMGFDPDGDLTGFDIKAALRWDVARVLDCDAVIVITDNDRWYRSKGVLLEMRLALLAEVPLYHLDGPYLWESCLLQ